MPGSFSSRLPQRSSSMLLTMISTRSTRSPLSYILRVSLPKCTLNTVKSYTERSMIFSNRPSRALVLLRTLFATEDGFESGHVQQVGACGQ